MVNAINLNMFNMLTHLICEPQPCTYSASQGKKTHTNAHDRTATVVRGKLVRSNCERSSAKRVCGWCGGHCRAHINTHYFPNR